MGRGPTGRAQRASGSVNWGWTTSRSTPRASVRDEGEGLGRAVDQKQPVGVEAELVGQPQALVALVGVGRDGVESRDHGRPQPVRWLRHDDVDREVERAVAGFGVAVMTQGVGRRRGVLRVPWRHGLLAPADDVGPRPAAGRFSWRGSPAQARTAARATDPIPGAAAVVVRATTRALPPDSWARRTSLLCGHRHAVLGGDRGDHQVIGLGAQVVTPMTGASEPRTEERRRVLNTWATASTAAARLAS